MKQRDNETRKQQTTKQQNNKTTKRDNTKTQLNTLEFKENH